jgi:hypothetical protein
MLAEGGLALKRTSDVAVAALVDGDSAALV